MPVSPATETKLRAAMQRLLNGTPQRTDGALTKENLAREAAVSHATVHRAETILSEWNTRTGQPPARDTPIVPVDDPITALRAALRDANQKITTLNGSDLRPCGPGSGPVRSGELRRPGSPAPHLRPRPPAAREKNVMSSVIRPG